MNIEFSENGYYKLLTKETIELLRIYDISNYTFLTEGPVFFNTFNGGFHEKLTCYLAFYDDNVLQVDFILGKEASINHAYFYYLHSIHYTYLDQVEISFDCTGRITDNNSFAQNYTLFGIPGDIVVYGDDDLHYLDKTLSELKTFLDITRE